jgi:inorganic pyrophosphatase
MPPTQSTDTPTAPTVDVVVEIPRGSRNKYEQADDGTIWFDRRLGGPAGFPGDYGYVKGLEGEDGDALDALVLIAEPTFPGIRVRCRVLGSYLLRVGDIEETKLICVPQNDPSEDHLGDLGDLPDHALDELDAFFEAYRMLEPKTVTVLERRDLASTRPLLVD